MEGMKQVAMISHMAMGDNYDHYYAQMKFLSHFYPFCSVNLSIKIQIYEYVRQIIYNGWSLGK